MTCWTFELWLKEHIDELKMTSKFSFRKIAHTRLDFEVFNIPWNIDSWYPLTLSFSLSTCTLPACKISYAFWMQHQLCDYVCFFFFSLSHCSLRQKLLKRKHRIERVYSRLHIWKMWFNCLRLWEKVVRSTIWEVCVAESLEFRLYIRLNLNFPPYCLV